MTEQREQKVRPERQPISKRLRFEVFKRDGFQCAYCGATPPGALLECDHVDPVSLGGGTEIDNLVTACQNCNRGKSNIPLSDVPQSMSDRAAEVIEREAQITGFQAVLKQRRMRIDAEAQEVLESFCEMFSREGIPHDHFTSIKRFVDKLGLDQCLWAVDRAQQEYRRSYRRAFLYFCGICWRKIREANGGGA